jgi:hypothetical protein
MLASSYRLEDLVGKRVRSLRDFADVPTGTLGTVVEVYSIGKAHDGITVEWDKPLAAWSNRKLQDGFGRDSDFDETQYLEVCDTEET